MSSCIVHPETIMKHSERYRGRSYTRLCNKNQQYDLKKSRKNVKTSWGYAAQPCETNILRRFTSGRYLNTSYGR